jgi:cellulose synthase/poly-beta-1,6-N-acetylglucosamine synthase-like glycosyltransferase
MRLGRVAQVITAPTVSVVMGAYNGAATLRDAVRSVLSQEGVDFEFIIVDDGSTDASPAILEQLSRADRRIRVIRQENLGLTRALIRGCAEASGRFIARQDCDDLSLPGKLKKQLQAIEGRTDVALVSCGTRFVGPNGELLYEISTAEGDATEGLLTLDPQRLRGPAGHGSTLFRRDLYERVGGYREQFYLAQDLDLWTRLVEHGRHLVIPDVLYQVTVAIGSISSLQRDRQVACASVILECARMRRAGLTEAPALARARTITCGSRKVQAADRAAALYFIGACLRKRCDPRARQYFVEALRTYPLHLKSAVRILLG